MLSVAHDLMRQHRVRHLPVLDRGELVGVVSQRDLYFIETLKGVDPAQVTVAEAMSTEPFLVSPDDALGDVARTMAERKFGSAVVMEDEHVVGLFTTTDALRALAAVIAEDEARGAPPPPRRAPRRRPAAAASRPAKQPPGKKPAARARRSRSR